MAHVKSCSNCSIFQSENKQKHIYNNELVSVRGAVVKANCQNTVRSIGKINVIYID